MFECKKSPADISRFVGHDIRKLVEVDNYLKCYSRPISLEDDSSPVQLFGIELYYLDHELLQNLVQAARDRMGKLSVEEVRRDLGDTECSRWRSEINLLFRIILGNFKEFHQDEVLQRISTIQDCLPRLGDVVEDTGMMAVKDMNSVNYEYFHAVLDWRWFGLMLSFEIGKNSADMAEFRTCYHNLLECLIRSALVKYNKTGKDKLLKECYFYCPCVRKIWIGMMALSTDSGSGDLDFWDILMKAFEKAELEQRDVRNKHRKMSGLTLMRANDFLFQTWLMHGIASLYQYRMLNESTFKETPIIALAPDFTLLEKAIKEAVQGDRTEEHFRIFLLLLKPIYTGWWQIKHDFLVLLWEYFSKRLNSPFQLPNETLSNLACISRSPTGFVEQAHQRASQDAFDTLNAQVSSFKCYLTLLAYMLRYYSDAAQKTKVQILFNRTILKIAPPKLETMTEQAIFNFSLLMLTMLHATPYQDDYPRLSKQLLRFKLDSLTPSADMDATIRRITTITLANMALTLMFSERGFNKSSHVQQLLNSLDDAYRKYGERLQPALHVLAEGMCAVYERSISMGQFANGEERFLGEWLGRYLKGCSEGERDALLGTISGIFNCFNGIQNFRPEEHIQILQPLFELVLPHIKDAFSSETKQPLLVAELAAHFTLFSKGQTYATPFLALFSFFSDNITAPVDLRLHYTKLIVSSNRASEIEEKLVLRSWLKFALLNGRSQLRELSQVVCRMPEFRALCEIPEYDLCDGDEEPIGLFFKFVGRKYKDYEGKDNRAQYEMTIKVHALFQHFDKWITNPSVVVLKRIMSVLALALKECGAVIYIRSNTTCLYHLAFNHYFLPMAVLTDRNVSNTVILAMGKVWHRIMDAMGQMNYTSDPVISDHVSNMMVKWVPQFVKFKDKGDTSRPFVTFFSSKNESLVTFAFQRFSFFYVELQGISPKTNSDSGMKILVYLLDTLRSTQDNGKIALFIRLMFSTILDHAMIARETFPSKTFADELVNKMLECTRYNSNLIKMELKSSLSAFTKKHLPMETATYFRFMYKLADRDPDFIKSMISTIRAQLTETERMRGGGEDKHLRRLLMQLEGAVEASFSKQKK